MVLTPLPIDSELPSLVEAFRAGRNLVLEAEPGAGKTTRLPRALLDAGLLEAGECWILEPRRLAARLAAVRVAEELGEEVGRRVGYAVRFEQRVGKETRVRFVTEALLLRRLMADPQLKGIGVVLLDEFHERHLHGDLALTLLRRLQKERRPDLRIGVMSATLEAEPVRAFLDAAHARVSGRPYPVEIRHAPRPDSRPLAEQVASAVEAIHCEGCPGHILVFLPGAAEIRQCMSSCDGLARRLGLNLLPLHGSLSLEAQKAAVAPSATPKVLFATNVAESSVTVDGVVAVIDSGLAREAVHWAWSGLSSLRTGRISQARCIQRAGRAGRQGPGRCVRLYLESDFQNRPSFDLPELQRADLAETLLALAELGVADAGALEWFEAPPAAALAAAKRLMQRLDALDGNGHLSGIGRRMARLPLHPRLARLVVAGQDADIPETAALAAALLEAGDLAARSDLRRRQADPHALTSDLWPRMDAFHEVEAANFGGGTLRQLGLDPAAVHQARQAFRELCPRGADEPKDAEERLMKALLRAYPDRVARRGGGATFAVVGGGGARLDAFSRCQREDLVVALEAEEVQKGAGREVVIRAASRIEPEWILEAYPDAISDRESMVFHPATASVEHRSALLFEDLVLDESRRRAEAGTPGVAACLAAAALSRGLGDAQETVERLASRIAFLGRTRPDLELPEGEDLRRALVEAACAHAATLKDLTHADWRTAAREAIGETAFGLLDKWAPEWIQLKGKRATVHYDGDAPHIESRLQDFLGMKQGPSIAGGSVPLVLHLLAPNQRALQVTTDLAGFWQRTYQELRPALSRRYPKHAWPEKPA